MCTHLFCCFTFLMSLHAATTTSTHDVRPFVTTSTAKIYGKWVEVNSRQVPNLQQTIAAYTRIPYVEPPVGELRYKAPVPKVLASDFDATRPGIACPQVVADIAPLALNQSEDCLYLDVFVPERKPSSAAVMVWIHGGGYSSGAGSVDELLPIPLAVVGEVIVVTMNYRVGSLGFLATGDEEIPANVGLLDQREALLWVRDNIAAFGGDPERVTIFGESAGSGSVNLHLLSPMSAGLFSRAIMQSGAINPAWSHDPSMESAVKETFEFGRHVGCDANTSTELVTCLREKSVEDYMAYLETAPLGGYMIKPVVDGHFLPEDPLKLAADGSFNPVDVINGYLLDEGTIMIMIPMGGIEHAPSFNQTAYHDFIAIALNTQDPVLVDATAFVYTVPSQINDPEAEYLDSLTKMMGDIIFTCSSNAMTRNLVKAGRTVYSYVMKHVPSVSFWGSKFTWLKATHAEDIPYVFGYPLMTSYADLHSEEVGSFFGGNFNDDEAMMSLQVMRYWANFAKTGDPNLSSLETEQASASEYPSWPKSTTLDPMYKELSSTFPNHGGFPDAKECFYWDSLFPTLTHNSLELAELKSVLAEKVETESERSCADPEHCPEN